MSDAYEDAQVETHMRVISAQKLDDKATHNTDVVFSFGVNMEETERKSDHVILTFQMTMNTEPNIARFTIEGSATVSGEAAQLDKMLTADPETHVPEVFTRIYQQVYSVVFMLAGTLDVPYPSPALLKKPHVEAAMTDQQ